MISFTATGKQPKKTNPTVTNDMLHCVIPTGIPFDGEYIIKKLKLSGVALNHPALNTRMRDLNRIGIGERVSKNPPHWVFTRACKSSLLKYAQIVRKGKGGAGKLRPAPTLETPKLSTMGLSDPWLLALHDIPIPKPKKKVSKIACKQ